MQMSTCAYVIKCVLFEGRITVGKMAQLLTDFILHIVPQETVLRKLLSAATV